MAYLDGLKGIANRINKLEAENNFNLQLIDIEKLIPSTNNFYGIREIEELAGSIKESGLMHNLVVRKISDDEYEILSGERRYHALKSLSYKKVPCQVKELNDTDGEILLIQANAKQRELTPTKKMKSIERLEQLYAIKKANGEEVPKGKTRDIIGKDMGLSGVQVGRYSKVSKGLIEDFKSLVDAGDITLTDAVVLSGLSKEEQAEIYNQVKELDPKEDKQEINILIQGIKQPVEKAEDKELLDQVNVGKITLEQWNEDKKNEILSCLENDPAPRIVFNRDDFHGILRTIKVKIVDTTLVVKMANGEIKVNIDFFYTRVVDWIDYKYGKLEPRKAWKVNDEIYLWFKAME